MKKAIIFDIDGLLVDSENVTFQLWQEWFKKYDRTMTWDFYVSLVGRRRSDIDRMLVEKYGSDVPVVQILDEVHAHMDTIPLPKKPGLDEILAYGKEKGMKMAVATSSNRSHGTHTLTNIGILDYFDVIVCGDMVSRGKPDPEIYETAARELGMAPEDCVVLEDAAQGILSAHGAGIDVICVPDMKMPDQEILDLTWAVVPDLTAATEFLKQQED